MNGRRLRGVRDVRRRGGRRDAASVLRTRPGALECSGVRAATRDVLILGV